MTMEEPPRWAAGVNIDVPTAARMYDYALGGSHNFAADRDAVRRARQAFPDIDLVARSNRGFLHRAVRYLVAEAGVTQFLDLGSGVPTVGNVHEIAQSVNPESRVVYVDIDAIAVAHAELLLRDDPRSAVLRADVRDAEAILGSDVVRDMLDLTRPVAVLMVAVLHFIADEDDPAWIIETFRAATVAGSHLVLSHVSAEDRQDDVRGIGQVYSATPTGVTPRARARVRDLLGGYELVEPGLVFLPEWRPDAAGGAVSMVDPLAATPERAAAFAAVGRR